MHWACTGYDAFNPEVQLMLTLVTAGGLVTSFLSLVFSGDFFADSAFLSPDSLTGDSFFWAVSVADFDPLAASAGLGGSSFEGRLGVGEGCGEGGVTVTCGGVRSFSPEPALRSAGLLAVFSVAALSPGSTGGAGEELLGTLAFGITGAMMAVRGGGGPTAGRLAAPAAAATGGVGEEDEVVFDAPLAPFCAEVTVAAAVAVGGAAGALVVAASGCETGGGAVFSGVLAAAPCM